MKRRKVVSREYKVMLQAPRFAGGRKQLLDTARRLWDEFSRAVGPVIAEARGTLDTIEKERLIVFLDSDAQHLRAAGYIFRMRRPLNGKAPEVTLKFRHPDRYVAENRQMKSTRLRTETSSKRTSRRRSSRSTAFRAAARSARHLPRPRLPTCRGCTPTCQSGSAWWTAVSH